MISNSILAQVVAMAARVFVIFTLLIFFLSGAQSVRFTITNKCSFPIWPGTLASGGTPQLASTGFKLAPGASRTLDAPKPWIGRFWARTQCSRNAAGRLTCATADCASGQEECRGAGAIPPASLAEFTLQNSNQDFYDVSLVDGFNLPVAVTPQGGSGSCRPSSCPANVNNVCPRELAVKGPDGRVVACKSACLAFNKPEYCCTGSFNKPETCPPTNYSRIFKNQCPQAYSYAYDDLTSTFTCTNANYIITFCP